MPLLLDCDPGKDDAVALALAVRHRDALDLAAVTTVSGNVGIDCTTANALRLLERCGAADVPVHRGATAPLVVDRLDASHVHGEDGLGGVEIPDPTVAEQTEAAATRLARARGATIAAIGPVTNLARALELDLNAGRGWERVVVMGGGRDHGNVTPHAEFNLYADPHAFDALLGSGAAVTLLTLDTTNAMKPSDALLFRMSTASTPGGRLFAALWRENRFAIHDACVVGFLARPELFEIERVEISIDLDGETRGRTRFEPQEGGVEIDWVSAIDREGFFAWVEESLG